MTFDLISYKPQKLENVKASHEDDLSVLYR